MTTPDAECLSGFGDVHARAAANGARHGTPVLIGPGGWPDPRVNLFFRTGPMAEARPGTWRRYAYALVVWLDYLNVVGRGWAEATASDVEAFKEWRLTSLDNAGRVQPTSFDTDRSALNSFYSWAGQRYSVANVARMLREMGFSLQGNAKVVEGRQHEDRDAQFGYLNSMVAEHAGAGQPVISVDSKKKELVGEFKIGGREYQPAGQPERVSVHDFPDKNLGKAIPHGIYDVSANTGWVSVGVDHDTSAFAVATLRRWWQTVGAQRYPDADRLLICADGGGSNGYRIRAWKIELAKLAAETGLRITVCHLPPGTSKWNKIEHRLFSQITMNWRGRPLISHQVIVNLISATTTSTGLLVQCVLDTGDYPTGAKYTPADVEALPLTRHDFHGEWNYTLAPDTP